MLRYAKAVEKKTTGDLFRQAQESWTQGLGLTRSHRLNLMAPGLSKPREVRFDKLYDPQILEKYQILCANCNWIKRYENKEMKAAKVVEQRNG
jgi:hypothetical protein